MQSTELCLWFGANAVWPLCHHRSLHPSQHMKEMRNWWYRPFLLEGNLPGCLHAHETVCIAALSNSKFLFARLSCHGEGSLKMTECSMIVCCIFLAANPPVCSYHQIRLTVERSLWDGMVMGFSENLFIQVVLWLRNALSASLAADKLLRIHHFGSCETSSLACCYWRGKSWRILGGIHAQWKSNLP